MQMRILELTCVFFFIMCMTSMALAKCKTYPPSVEEDCVWECVDYLLVSIDFHDHTPPSEFERRCRDGEVDFYCDSKRFYDYYHSDTTSCAPP